MTRKDSTGYRTVITVGEFILALLRILPRLPGMAYDLITGLKLIKGNAAMSWGSLIEEAAKKYPRRPALKSHDGNYTYEEYNALVNQYAHYFMSRGVGMGDSVALMMENRPEFLFVYGALAKIGAVASLININQRGASLAHSFNLHLSKAFVIGEECLEFFEEAKREIEHVPANDLYVVRDKGTAAASGYTDLAAAVAGFPKENPAITGETHLNDRAAYVFTSGTSGGLPKAAVIIHKRIISAMVWFGKFVNRTKPSDTVYVSLPFFHTNAITLGIPVAMTRGAALAMRRKFSASNFLGDVRQFDATVFIYVGEMCRYLMATPEKPDDRKNPLRTAIGNGLRPDIWKAFKKRFGIKRIYELYGAADGVGIFTNVLNLDNTVGLSITPYAIARFDVEREELVRGADGFLQRVAKGEVGLALMKISEKTPFAGYSDKKKNEEKIVRDAFEKGDAWFNTGDLIRNMGFKHAQFADRMGDTFRWKGENVSTTEVEKALDAFPGVSSSAVYGVTMPGGDGKIGMAAVIPEKGATPDLAGLAAALRKSLPKYAVPAFIRLVDDFEWTATHKIKKFNFKDEGYDPGKVNGPLYVLLPGEDSYRPLDGELYQSIMSGRYRF